MSKLKHLTIKEIYSFDEERLTELLKENDIPFPMECLGDVRLEMCLLLDIRRRELQRAATD